MDVSVWYWILGAGVIFIAVIERFVIYSLLVLRKQWLPEKAGSVANICSGITLLVGIAALAGNAVLSRR